MTEINIPDEVARDWDSAVTPEERELKKIKYALDDIFTKVCGMEKRMDETETMIRKLIAEVGPVVNDVIPMVNNLLENPLMKMAFRGKK